MSGLLPDQVVVGPFVFDIVEHDGPFEPQEGTERKKGETRQLAGQCVRSSLQIHLDTTMAPGQVRTVFFHELLHACAGLAGNEYWVNFRRDELEEFVVDNMSNVLVMVLRDNPAIAEFIMEPDLEIGFTSE
jgi:hypothetical protein